MSDDVTFLGYDRDGDKVWRVGAGGAVAATSAKEALEYWNRGGGLNALSSYEDRYGPITKEPS